MFDSRSLPGIGAAGAPADGCGACARRGRLPPVAALRSGRGAASAALCGARDRAGRRCARADGQCRRIGAAARTFGPACRTDPHSRHASIATARCCSRLASSPEVAVAAPAARAGSAREGFVLRSAPLQWPHTSRSLPRTASAACSTAPSPCSGGSRLIGPWTRSTFATRPTLSLRMLDHWDNLDGFVERGYAGKSLWDWQTPAAAQSIARYTDYARANASIGINGTVLNNVNANAQILTPAYLRRWRRSPTCSGPTAYASICPPASARRSRSAA